MRVAMVVALALLASCAGERLASAPPPGVDLSGRWQLNVEESDDPLHLIQSQVADPSKAARSQGQGGRGGRGGPGGPGGPGGGFGGPSLPAVGALSQGLRWPGREVEIKQVAGVVAMTSAGVNQVYQPMSGTAKNSRPPPEDDPHAAGRGGRDRSARGRDRDGPPAVCGWEGRTLVIQAGDPDDDHPPFEERYNLSDDGQRLIEVVGFKGGRSEGFTVSRVWDRLPAEASSHP